VLRDKKILIGITGGIAAYKIPQLVRDLSKAAASVRIVMTESAKEFVSPLTLSTVSGNEVIVGSFPELSSNTINTGTWHIQLAQWADVMLLAPATANTIAKIANGYTDNAVTTLVLAMRCPVIISPSMDTDMWFRETTQRNVNTLRELGYIILPPTEGELASGLMGAGRLPNLSQIQKNIEKILQYSHQDLLNKKILISAGPTFEPIDPVRYIGNRSSGKMGFALANAAAQRGADVTLIAGPVNLKTPRNVKRIDVETARQMSAAIIKRQEGMNVIIMAAAVADFTPIISSAQKIKKDKSQNGHLTLELKKTNDILQQLGEKKNNSILVGFAVETSNEIANAEKKLRKKHLDIIILNNPLKEGAGFETDTNIVTIISKHGKIERLKKIPKYEVAQEILNRVSKLL
jgi:phosphopantothenoylcysteine decarboxylase/phosphopantothenate--cysteine ligase